MTEVDADRQEPPRPCRGAGASCPWSVVRGPWSVVRGPWSVVCSAKPCPPRPSAGGPATFCDWVGPQRTTDNWRLSTKS